MRIISFFILLVVFSCSKDERSLTNKKLNYLALGDSYTIGESVEFTYSYPIQLKNQINSTDKIIDSVRVIAKTGWTTGQLIDTLSQLNLKYDIVSLLIGVNNQFRGYNITQYREEFENLLIRSINFSLSDISLILSSAIPKRFSWTVKS